MMSVTSKHRVAFIFLFFVLFVFVFIANLPVTTFVSNQLRTRSYANTGNIFQEIVLDCKVATPSCNSVLKQEWDGWGRYVVGEIKKLLVEGDSSCNNTDWDVIVSHIEHVKSYAPRIDHLVLDVECRPRETQGYQQ